jgi:hypothetical protein
MEGETKDNVAHTDTTGRVSRDKVTSSPEHVKPVQGTVVEKANIKNTRTLSLDSQQFLHHILSIDGDELYNYLMSEPGASQSPTKSHHLDGFPPSQKSTLQRQMSDETQLAQMMHALLEEQPIGGQSIDLDFPLGKGDTVNKILGDQLYELAQEVAADPVLTIPPKSDGMVDCYQGQQPAWQAGQGMDCAVNSSATCPQQYLTLLDGKILLKTDGSAFVATLPDGQAQLTVPIPDSTSVLQYIPLVGSTVLSQPQHQAQVNVAPVFDGGVSNPSHTKISASASPFDQRNLLSPSQTEQMVADAQKQHSQLQQQTSSQQLPRPHLRLVESGTVDTQPSVGAPGENLLDRKVSHKRERSGTVASLMVSESLQAPERKLTNNMTQQIKNSDDGDEQSPNSSLSPPSCGKASCSTIAATGKSSEPNETGNDDIGTYMKSIKRFSDGLKIDDELAGIIERTLATPPGVKRRGRPPGRSKNTEGIPGFFEPSDAEILANLLIADANLRTSPPDELKKLIRKEKNRISAAISRHRMTHETKMLEGQVKQLEEEKTSLSQWLSSTPEVQPHRILLAQGREVPLVAGDQVKRPPVRHLSL